MGFRALRVLNDDRVAPGKGFGAHGHRDMEILSYVLDGQLAHKDSMGEEHVLGPNEVQAMSAGSGVIHSEFNGSDTEPTHFFQIWLVPETRGIKPSYQQFAYDPSEKRGTLRLIAGPDKNTNPPSAFINQDARMYAAVLGSGETITFPIAHGASCLGAGRRRRDRGQRHAHQGGRWSRGERRSLADASRRRHERRRAAAVRPRLTQGRLKAAPTLKVSHG